MNNPINSRVAQYWEKLCAVELNAAAAAWDQLSSDPTAHSERQTRLKGSLATGAYEGKVYERWQYEVTGAAVHIGHPKATE